MTAWTVAEDAEGRFVVVLLDQDTCAGPFATRAEAEAECIRRETLSHKGTMQ